MTLDRPSIGLTSFSTRQRLYPTLDTPVVPPREVEDSRVRTSKIPVFLKTDQVEALLDAPTRLRDRLILRLLYCCAMRISEVLGLQLEDVDVVDRVIKVCHAVTPSGMPKEYKERFVPVDAETLRLLVEYAGARTRGRFFTLKARQAQYLVKKYAKEIGIIEWEKISPHKLRHSFAVNWVRNGGDIERLRRILGHSSLSTTQIYLQFQFEDIQEEYDRIMGSGRKVWRYL